MPKPFALALLALPLFALAVTGSPVAAGRTAKTAAKATPAPLSPRAKRGLAFAQDYCSACHAVTANGSSPNPESPPFEDIANTPGLTVMTLRQFLRDSHNYPAAMDFKVEPARIRDLAGYIVTLKRPGYRRGV